YVLEDLDLDRMDAAFRDAVSRGEMSASDLPGSSPRHFLRVRGANAMHVPGVDGETSAGKTDAELKARAAMLRIYRFFRSQPGLESFTVESFAAECGIRETVVIEGETEIRVEEYESGTVYPDAVCFSFYPIDRHRPDGLGIDKRFLREGVVPTIPFGAMLPAGTSNLIAAGRMVCGDPLANSAYRVQASCMAMGQAAGAAAALASRQRLELREVSLPELRRLLVRHGALVPEPMT
ncbi:MAG: FAD-dependent oxidoreductase, partial [Kiritimatiellae bacterium]|nr:FAD-dependent oxidoreductase [Kiritimatiellia bacterium]